MIPCLAVASTEQFIDVSCGDTKLLNGDVVPLVILDVGWKAKIELRVDGGL